MTFKYLLFRFRGRPVIALPDGARALQLGGIGCYRAITLRRALFVWSVRAILFLGVARFFAESLDVDDSSLIPSGFSNWFDDVRGVADSPSAEAVIIWPPEPDRGRLYVHALTPDGEPVAFAKTSVNIANDQCLMTEADALQKLGELDLTTFRIPELIGSGQWNNRYYLVFRPIPANAKPIGFSWDLFPEDCVKEYAGPINVVKFDLWLREYTQTSNTSWSESFDPDNRRMAAFTNELCKLEGQTLEVCRVHGDLGPQNIIEDHSGLLIYDWEECFEQGPQLTDIVMYFLILNQRKILSNPEIGIQLFANHFFGKDKSFNRIDVVLALAFIHSHGKSVATRIIEHWHHVQSQNLVPA